VLLDGHGWGEWHCISPLLPFFFSTALHPRGGGLGERATAEALIPASLKPKTSAIKLQALISSQLRPWPYEVDRKSIVRAEAEVAAAGRSSF
jgi:hypothetical protein